MNDFVNLDGQDNMGGLVKFEFADIMDVKSITGSTVVMKSGKSWSKGIAQLNSLSFDESEEQSAAGEIYKRLIKGKYPKGSTEMLVLMGQMVRRRFIVKTTDRNGDLRLVGSLEMPLIFSLEYKSGGAASGFNGIEFSFSGAGSEASPYID